MTQAEALRKALSELKDGEQISQATEPIYELLVREHPEITRELTAKLRRLASDASTVKRGISDPLAIVARQYLATAIWIGMRAKELERE
jgi:hypothetical protein